jgi:hypothetical protein
MTALCDQTGAERRFSQDWRQGVLRITSQAPRGGVKIDDCFEGELMIGDTIVNDMESKDRDIAIVFQNYALYPHMTVAKTHAGSWTLRYESGR